MKMRVLKYKFRNATSKVLSRKTSSNGFQFQRPFDISLTFINLINKILNESPRGC